LRKENIDFGSSIPNYVHEQVSEYEFLGYYVTSPMKSSFVRSLIHDLEMELQGITVHSLAPEPKVDNQIGVEFSSTSLIHYKSGWRSLATADTNVQIHMVAFGFYCVLQR